MRTRAPKEVGIRAVAVVTDSAASLPPGVADQLGISIVPIHLRIGDREVPEQQGAEAFYEQLRRGKERATTATPSPGEFLEAFENARADGVVCVTIAGSVSGIHGSAAIAADQAAMEVEVVDSGSASMAQGFVAMEAARAASQGDDLGAAAAQARDVAGRCGLVAAIQTFEHLRRSGRVNRLVSYAGTMLDIKPVFRMRTGTIEAVARPRTWRRALERVLEEVRREVGDHPVHLAAVHADAEGDARDLLARAAEGAEVVEQHVAGFTPAMGAHTGPGVVGLAWFCD